MALEFTTDDVCAMALSNLCSNILMVCYFYMLASRRGPDLSMAAIFAEVFTVNEFISIGLKPRRNSARI